MSLRVCGSRKPPEGGRMKKECLFECSGGCAADGHGRVVAINGDWNEAQYFGQVERSAEVVAAAKRSGWIQGGDECVRDDSGAAGVGAHLQVRHDGLSRRVGVAQ